MIIYFPLMLYKASVLQITFFQLTGNCKAEFSASESTNKDVENMGSKEALERDGSKTLKNCRVL